MAGDGVRDAHQPIRGFAERQSGSSQRLNRAGLTIVLVTHEPDIATYAGRHLSFRDGRLKTDVRVAAPVAAAAALTSLPREDEDAA